MPLLASSSWWALYVAQSTYCTCNYAQLFNVGKSILLDKKKWIELKAVEIFLRMAGSQTYLFAYLTIFSLTQRLSLGHIIFVFIRNIRGPGSLLSLAFCNPSSVVALPPNPGVIAYWSTPHLRNTGKSCRKFAGVSRQTSVVFEAHFHLVQILKLPIASNPKAIPSCLLKKLSRMDLLQ